ncbi:hypothetical protein K227x_37460 [Rubripirellula lacrimiformis]|uniref:Uncharacterized protein n=1 Tax=Rubripirellula lacrimiformis TaxID=1930273 RepID=A0A517NDZ2_9BACT|nr:hypothetical protein K227x_37460 [Rubripirellula lacrimiformis]
MVTRNDRLIASRIIGWIARGAKPTETANRQTQLGRWVGTLRGAAGFQPLGMIRGCRDGRG